MQLKFLIPTWFSFSDFGTGDFIYLSTLLDEDEEENSCDMRFKLKKCSKFWSECFIKE